MIKKENLFLLGINTIIVIVVMVLLFKQQDMKIRSYLKKIEKKSFQKINNNIERPVIVTKMSEPVINNDNNKPINKVSDIDSFVDPLRE
jgi:hypothetical protein